MMNSIKLTKMLTNNIILSYKQGAHLTLPYSGRAMLIFRTVTTTITVTESPKEPSTLSETTSPITPTAHASGLDAIEASRAKHKELLESAYAEVNATINIPLNTELGTPTQSVADHLNNINSLDEIGASVSQQEQRVNTAIIAANERINALDKLKVSMEQHRQKVADAFAKVEDSTPYNELQERIQLLGEKNQAVTDNIPQTENVTSVTEFNNEIKFTELPLTPELISQEEKDKLAFVQKETTRILAATEAVVDGLDTALKTYKINLERTDEATLRQKGILANAEKFLESLQNPYRIALYAVAGISCAFTVYNIVRYGQLPFTSLFRKILGETGQATSNVLNPVVSPVFNLTYPTPPTPPMPPTAAIPKIGDIPFPDGITWSTVLVIGVIIGLKWLKK
jgi:hypothetical protein